MASLIYSEAKMAPKPRRPRPELLTKVNLKERLESLSPTSRMFWSTALMELVSVVLLKAKAQSLLPPKNRDDGDSPADTMPQ